MLGNLINRHDAVRLGRRLRRDHVTQIVSTALAPGRVLADRSAAGRPAGQVQWDEIPAIRRRWRTFGPREASFAALPRFGADFVCAVCSPRVEPWTGLEAGQVTATRARTAARLGYDTT